MVRSKIRVRPPSRHHRGLSGGAPLLEKNGFRKIAKASLPPAFPVMEVDTKFYHRRIGAADRGGS